MNKSKDRKSKSVRKSKAKRRSARKSKAKRKSVRKSKAKRKSVRKSKTKRRSVRKSKVKRRSVRKSKAKRRSVRKSKGRSPRRNLDSQRIHDLNPRYHEVVRMDYGMAENRSDNRKDNADRMKELLRARKRKSPRRNLDSQRIHDLNPRYHEVVRMDYGMAENRSDNRKDNADRMKELLRARKQS